MNGIAGMRQAVSGFVDHALFGPPSRRHTLPAALLRLLRYPFALGRDLASGELTLRATGLVYATLLALIPAVALSFAVLKGIGAHRSLEPLVLEFFRPIGDAAPQITHRLMQFAENVRGGIVGSVGLVLLLWTLVTTVKRVEDSFNFVWSVRRARSLPRRTAEYIALLVAGPVVVVAVIAFSKLAFEGAASHGADSFAIGRMLLQLAIQLAPYVIVTGLFTALYIVLPNTRVRIGPALAGALAAGLAWAATGKLFTELVIYTSRLTLVYAGFAIVVATLLWTYLGWLILLAGARLAFYIQNPAYLQLGNAMPRLSHEQREALALDVMVHVGRAHQAGDPPWTIDSLGASMALPDIVIADAAHNLERSGWLSSAEDGRLFPAREPGNIPLEGIVDSARAHGNDRILQDYVPAPGVRELQQALAQARHDACTGRSLADLLAQAPPAGATGDR